METNDKDNKKRISVITIVIIVVGIIAIIGIFLAIFEFNISKNNSNSTNDGDISNIEGEEYVEFEGETKINTSEYLQDEKFLGDFCFSNFYVYSIDGITRMEFDVYNDSDKRQSLEDFKFIVYDAEKEVGSIICQGDEFAAKQTKKLSIVVNCDLANMFDVYVEQIYNNVM